MKSMLQEKQPKKKKIKLRTRFTNHIPYLKPQPSQRQRYCSWAEEKTVTLWFKVLFPDKSKFDMSLDK